MLTNFSTVMRRVIVIGAVLFLAGAQSARAQTVANPFATGVTLSAGVASPQRVGAAVTFTAVGQGSTGYQYRFWLWTGGVATMVQNWSASATWSLPATTAPGTYVVQADVRTNSTVFALAIGNRDAYVKLSYTIAPL